jgi:hypothetical protein
MIFFIFEQNGVKVPTESNKQKILEKNVFFVGILEVTAEKSRIRIRKSSLRIQGYRIRTKISRIRNTVEFRAEMLGMELYGQRSSAGMLFSTKALRTWS